DPNLALEIATAYISLSHVQAGTSLNLGQDTESDESLIKADSFVNAVLSVSPGNRQALLTSAEINHDRMNLADYDGRYDAALAYARKTAAPLDALLGLGHASASELRQADRFFSNISLTYKNLHLYEESVRYARRSLEIARSQSFQDSVPNTLSVMADSLRFSGDLDGALKAIREARTLVEGTDYSTESKRTLAWNAVLYREGVILDQDGQVSLQEPDEAITVLQRALDLMDSLAEKDPSESRSRTLLGQDVRELGPILGQRDPEKALVVYDRGLLRVREVKNVRARRNEAHLLATSSYVL